MKYMHRYLLLTALVVAACTAEPYEAPIRPGTGQEEQPAPTDPTSKAVVLEAVIEAAVPETKADIATDGQITWSEQDSIGLWTSKGRWARLVLDSSAGLKRGMFTGELDTDENPAGYAVHPYADHSLAGSVLTLTLPEEGDGQIPMAAKVPEDAALSFKVLSGAIYLSVGEIPEGAKALVLEADTPISGTFTADLAAEDPSLTWKEGGQKYVSLPIKDGEKAFVIPLPAGNYTLSYYFSDGTAEIAESREELGGIDIARGKMAVIENGSISSYTDLFVTPEGSGRHKGTSWDNAFSPADLATIFTGQASEENIARYGGATLHFVGGKYTPEKSLNFDFTKASAAVSFRMEGGYSPESHGKDLSLHDPAQYPTVIDGSSSATGRFARFDLKCHLTVEDMAFDNFSSGISLFYLWTGATNKDIDVTFRRCSFSGNKTDEATNGVLYGGVFFVRGGRLNIESCSFDGNAAGRGAAIACLGPGVVRVSGTDLAPTTFTASTAETGGAFYVENTTAEVAVDHTVFEGNTATASGNTWGAGGAVALMRNNDSGTMAVSFTDCMFKGNKAPAACAGAISLYNAEPKSLNLTRCRFEGNECLSRGGALYTDSGANGKDIYRMTECVFSGNKVTGSASGQGYGGAVDVQNNFKGSMYLDRCTFSGNVSPNGGAAWSNYNNGMVCSIYFNGCRFNGNYVDDATGAKAALYFCSGYVGFHNCAIWDNCKEGQSTPRDILTEANASSKAYILLSQCTIHQKGGNACVYLGSNTARTNIVNSILATSGYPVSIKTGSYQAGSSGDHVLQIGKSNAFHTGHCQNGILLGYDAWKDKFENGYHFTGNLTEAGFTPMETSTSAYIRALGEESDLAFDAWLSGLGVYSRDIDGNLRSGAWTPGCVQVSSGSNPAARRVSILGDSISTYDGFLSGAPLRPHYPRGDVQDVTQTWWHQLIYKKMQNATLEGNFSYAGSQVARATNTNYAGTTWYGQGFVEKFLRDGCGHPDVVFIFGGTNDYMHKETRVFPGGEIVNTATTSPSEAVLKTIFDTADAAVTKEEIDALPDTDFCSAYAKLLRLVKNRCPEASIVCIIGDILNQPVQKSILAIAGHYNCPVVDLFAAAGYNDTANVPKIDGVHPNAAGMTYICNKIYNETKSFIE